MLTTIRQVNEEFFKKFYSLKIPVEGVLRDILCRYARKSSYDYSEEQDNQIYPCIAIYDYSPKIKDDWYIDLHTYFGGKSLDGLYGYICHRPIWMEFRYDVSIATKSYIEFMAMQDYFMKNFVYEERFLFNKKLSGDDEVGDLVPYEIIETDIPRTDGVFEKNYEFTCSVWLYPKDIEKVELIQIVVLGIHPQDMNSALKTLITSDNKVILTKDGYIYGSTVYQSKFTAEEIESILSESVGSKSYDNIEKKSVSEYEKLTEKNERTLYILTKDD